MEDTVDDFAFIAATSKASEPSTSQLPKNFTPKAPHKFKPKGKKPFTKSQPKAQPQTQKSGPSIGSRSDGKSNLALTPYLSHFPVYVSNHGIEPVCETIFSVMMDRDPKLNVTLAQFKYVTCISFWSRVAHIARAYKYTTVPPEYYDLTLYAEGIKLPAVVADYLQNIGIVTLPNGTQVGPYVPEHLPEGYYMPLRFWLEGHPGERPPAGLYTIDSQWINAWNQRIMRSSRFDFGIRTLDNGMLKGEMTMLVSYLPDEGLADVHRHGERLAKPISPVNLSKAESDFGCACYYRNYREYDVWPGPWAELLLCQFVGVGIDQRRCLSEKQIGNVKLVKS